MNDAHWHLVVNHIPLIFPMVGVIVMMIGVISKSDAVKRTAYTIFILGAFASIGAMTTGEGAEEVVENISGITENYIHEHEEIAEVFALLSYILAGISCIGLWASFKLKKLSILVTALTLLFAMVVLFYGKQTGTTGGEIRHTEIRMENSIPLNKNAESAQGEDD
jgi:uncharacterized membrane protein